MCAQACGPSTRGGLWGRGAGCSCGDGFLQAGPAQGPVRPPLACLRVGHGPMAVHGCPRACRWGHTSHLGLSSPPKAPLGKCGPVLLSGGGPAAGGGLGFCLVSTAGSLGPLTRGCPRTLSWHCSSPGILLMKAPVCDGDPLGNVPCCSAQFRLWAFLSGRPLAAGMNQTTC